MKISKNEKVWLIVVVILYLLYNLHGFPKYGEPVATVIHGAITVIAIWIAVAAAALVPLRSSRLDDSTIWSKRFQLP